jgi:hypothetical protein
MDFRQSEDGACDIIFSWRERFILFFKGRIHLSKKATFQFSTELMNVVMVLAEKLPKEITDQPPNPYEEIKGE